MAEDLRNILQQTKHAEEEVALILSRLSALHDAIKNPGSTGSDNETAIENVKLKHRVTILKRSIEEEKKNGKKKSKSHELTGNGIQELLTNIFADAITSAYPDLSDINACVSPSTKHFGDYQCNAALSLANQFKNKGLKLSPLEVANRIKENVSQHPVLDRMEVAPPGFINIWISKDFCVEQVAKIVFEGVQPPPLIEKHKVVIDFSSPNIAKEMHVGHLRSTIIGDSIARLLEFLGHDVKRINHVGDWGTQFGMLIAHLQEKFPDYLTVAPPITDLQSFYKESKARFDEDKEFKSKAYSCVVKLQSFDPDYVKAWNLICEESRKEFQVIYDKLGIVLEERGESFYQKRMEVVVKELEEKGLLEEDEGRKVMFGKEGEIPMTIVKSDGGFTYDTSDMAAIKHRIEEEKATWIIYVTDAGQATHFNILLSCAARAGYYDPIKVRVDHVMFGLVLGEDKKKFKTRSGETVKLNDLLQEGLRRAEMKLIEKKRDSVLTKEEFEIAKTAVAYGCIKYTDLSYNRISSYIFSFDKMLEDKGNTAVYLLYALTRIRSIARNANVSIERLREAALARDVAINHEKEFKLVKVLLRFNETLIKITKDLYLHHLCEFLYEVSITFSEFYDVCYCIEKDPATGEITKIHMNRLVLCEATAMIMEKCFHLLGIKPVSRM